MWFEWLWYSCYFSSSLHVGWFAHRYTICSAAMAQLLSNASQKLDEVIPRHRLALILAVKMACNLSDFEWLWLNSSHFYEDCFKSIWLGPWLWITLAASTNGSKAASFSSDRAAGQLNLQKLLKVKILTGLESLNSHKHPSKSRFLPSKPCRLWTSTDSWLDDIGAGRKSLNSFEMLWSLTVWLPHLEFLRSLVGFWPEQQSTVGRVFMLCSWWAANLNVNFAGFKYFLRMCLKLLDETIKPNETKDLKSNCWFSQCFCTV